MLAHNTPDDLIVLLPDKALLFIGAATKSPYDGMYRFWFPFNILPGGALLLINSPRLIG